MNVYEDIKFAAKRDYETAKSHNCGMHFSRFSSTLCNIRVPSYPVCAPHSPTCMDVAQDKLHLHIMTTIPSSQSSPRI